MLSIYTLEQATEWDKIVKSFSNYDTYWLSGYVRAFKIHGDGEPLLFYYVNNDTKAINVVMKRDIAKCPHFSGILEEGNLFDFSTPYGYGGWLIEGTDTDELFFCYNKWCTDNNIISEFVRFHPVVKNHFNASKEYEVIPLGQTVTMDLSSPDIIWENLTSKNRNMVRKAQKNNVVILNDSTADLYHVFRKIYNSTMDKDHAEKCYYFSEAFYNSILNDISENSRVFYAVYENKIIAAAIMIFANGKMNYHLSGSVQEFSYLAPTNLLLYEAALWGSANGYKTLYLGGGVGSSEDGLFKFKRAFYRGENLERFHIGKKIFNQDMYDQLISKRDAFEKKGFFPEYRT